MTIPREIQNPQESLQSPGENVAGLRGNTKDRRGAKRKQGDKQPSVRYTQSHTYHSGNVVLTLGSDCSDLSGAL